MINALKNNLLVNPVVVRELRQTVKSNIVILAMNFILLILLVIEALVMASGDSSGYVRIDDTHGRDLFGVLLIFLMVTIWGIMPLNAYFKFSKERDPDDPDLMFITNMTAGQILWGKYYTALAQMGLYFFSFLPFLLICYLFKGIDVITMFRSVVKVLIFAILISQIAIMLAAIPKRKFLLFTFAAAIAALGFFMIIYCTNELIADVYSSYSSGYSILLWYWPWLVAAILFSLSIFIVTRAIIMPDTANRAPLPRIFLTVLLFSSYVFCYNISLNISDNNPMLVWSNIMFWTSLATMLFGISERDRLNVRVIRTIPKGAKRWLYFPFYSGSASGIVWSLAFAACYCLGVIITPELLAGFSGSNEDIISHGLAFSLPHFYFYFLLTYFVTRWCLGESARRYAWFWSAIVIASMFFLTTFMCDSLDYTDYIYFFNPAAVFIFANMSAWRGNVYTDMANFSLIVSLAGFGGMLFLSMRFIVPQVRRFKADQGLSGTKLLIGNEESLR